VLSVADLTTSSTVIDLLRRTVDHRQEVTMPDKVQVADVESLYDRVNNPGNAGKTIVLAPGSYHLTRLNPLGAPRPNGGRLELQTNMSMSGVTGHPDKVVIDSSDPVNGPAFSLGAAGNAGTIRMGRGRQTVEWLTVVGGAKSAAGVQTDLVGGTPLLHIAHVVCTGSVRGIDVRNLGPEGAGRTLTVDLDDNEVTGNVTGNGQGIRFVNTASDGASIVASLHGNRSHGNIAGFLAANQASNGASVTIDSHNDRFDDNRIGGLILGGVEGMGATAANDNVVNLTMHAGSMARNRGVVSAPQEFSGGLSVVGGSAATAGSTSRNTVQVSIVGLSFSDNLNTDVKAWGARTPAAAPAGTHNTVKVKLQGVSAQAVTDRVDSEPSEPAGTNRAMIVQ
jgi:hypothetical protein